jgi:hypothetical protein
MFRSIRRLLFGEVSQTKISYHKSSLSQGKAGRIQAGNRFPYFNIVHQGNTVSVFHLIRQYQVKPFLIILYNLPATEFTGLSEEMFSSLSFEVNSANSATLKQTGFPSSFIVILRPDTYIAYISTWVDLNEIKGFMKAAYLVEGV